MTVRPASQIILPTKFVPSGQLAVGLPELLGDNLIFGAGPVDAAVAAEIDTLVAARLKGGPLAYGGQLGNSFENGVLGATVATGGTGDPDAWDSVIISGTGVAMVYDATPIAAGSSQSAKMTTTSAAANVNTAWNSKLGPITDLYGRFYFMADTLPGSTVGFELVAGTFLPAIGQNIFYISFDSTGKIRILDSGFSTVKQSTTVVGINTPCRIEFHYNGHTRQMDVQLFVGANKEGTTPDETLTQTNFNNGNTGGLYNSISAILWGNSNGVSVAMNVWYDGIMVRDGSQGFIGPVVIDAITPGAISATSTVSGSVGRVKAVTPATVSATSTVGGSVRALRAIKPGAISATSTVSGSIHAFRAIRLGAVAATSTVSGRVNKLARIAGAVAATSTVSGSIRPLRGILPSTINATSTVSGAIFKGAFRQISGAIAATSTVSGSVHAIRRVLPGAISATSTLSGSVSVRRGIIPGAISATSVVSGSVHALRRVLPATVAATSTLTGRVTAIHRVGGLITATSTVSGALRALRGLGGAVSATSTVSGFVGIGRRVLPAQISAISAVSGTVVARRKISGAILATSIVTGSVTARRKISGAINATSTVTGVLHPIHHIVGAISATSTVSGSVHFKRAIHGVITAQSSVSGKIVRLVHPAGVIHATSTVSGHIIARRAITGHIFATSTVSLGSLRVGKIVYGRTATLISAEYDPANLLDAGEEIPQLVSVR